MESKNKILFAYPVKHKEGMSKSEMLIPQPFFTDFERGSTQKVVVTTGCRLIMPTPSFFTVSIYGENEPEPNPHEASEGVFENLKAGVFEGNQIVMLTAFIVHDFVVHESGNQNVSVKLFGACKDGEETRELLDVFKFQFFLKIKGDA